MRKVWSQGVCKFLEVICDEGLASNWSPWMKDNEHFSEQEIQLKDGEKAGREEGGKPMFYLMLYKLRLHAPIWNAWQPFIYVWQGLKGESAFRVALFRNCILRVWWDFLKFYVVLLGKATLWRGGLVRWRGVAGELRSLSDSEGSVSAWGEPVSPTSSRRNLNLDRKSCHTTYQPAKQHISPTL